MAQLCVALNVGIFALRELAVPFHDRQLKALEGFYEQILKSRALVDGNKGDLSCPEKLRIIDDVFNKTFRYISRMKHSWFEWTSILMRCRYRGLFVRPVHCGCYSRRRSIRIVIFHL